MISLTVLIRENLNEFLRGSKQAFRTSFGQRNQGGVSKFKNRYFANRSAQASANSRVFARQTRHDGAQ
jgi:hypothetical protein